MREAADVHGAVVDTAEGHGVQHPGRVRFSGGRGRGIGGEQLVTGRGAEVHEDAVRDAGELGGVRLVVQHGRRGSGGQQHVRAELLHDGVGDALDERHLGAHRSEVCGDVDCRHDDPFASAD